MSYPGKRESEVSSVPATSPSCIADSGCSMRTRGENPELWLHQSTPWRIWPKAIQMTLTACSYTIGTVLRGHNKSVFKSTQERKQSLPGSTVDASKHLGIKALELKKKTPQLFESKGNAMLVCEQMCIHYPCVRFRPKIGRNFPRGKTGWPWDNLPVRAEDKSAELSSN